MQTPEQPDIAAQAAKALGITQLVPAVYQDLLQPAAKEAGQQLVVVAKAVGIALLPLKTAVWGYERIQDYLSAKVAAKLADKPSHEIISPDAVIAGPVIMNMVFTADAPHLREMYANLLSHAMHSPSASKAHPSFVQIIQQLSSAEAQILEQVAGRYKAGETIISESLRDNVINNASDEFIPFKWHDFCVKCQVEDWELIHAYYNNLIRLGVLIERTETESSLEDLSSGQADVFLTTTKSLCLTEYGDLFLNVCVREC